MAAKPNDGLALKVPASSTVLESFVGYHLRRANSRMMANFSTTLAPLSLRPVLLAMLAVIRENPGIIQIALGSELGIQRANLVPLLNELGGRGLVERRPAPRDRRALALFLTSEGEQLLNDAVALVREHEQRMLAGLSAAERTHLIELLGKIAAG